MRFKKIQLKNFLSCKDVSFNFNDGIIGIVGNNGSGKSSIFRDGLIYSLYGTPLRSKTPDKYINKDSDITKGFGLCLDVSIDSDDYRIVRTYIKEKNTQLFINGQLENALKSEVQDYIVEKIGIDEKLFNYITLLTPESKCILEMTNSERENFFYKLLNLEKFKQIETVSNKKRNKIEKRIIELETLIGKNKKNILDYDVEYFKLKSESNLYNSIINEEDNIIKTQKTLDLKNYIQNEIIKLEDKISKLNIQQTLELDIDTLNSKLNNARNKISELNASINNNNKTIEKFDKLYAISNKDSVCPTCEQSLNSDNIISVINNFKQSNTSFKQELSKYQNAETLIFNNLEFKKYNKELIELKSKISAIELNSSKFNIKELLASKESMNKIKLLEDNIKKLHSDNETLVNELDIIKIQKERCDRISLFASETPEKIMNKIFISLLNETNSILNNFTLSTESYLQQYLSCSTGERFRINIALRIALNIILSDLLKKNTIDTFIIDEGGLGTLDINIANEIMQNLQSLLDNKILKQIILITHEQELLSYCNSVYKIEKNNGETEIIKL